MDGIPRQKETPGASPASLGAGQPPKTGEFPSPLPRGSDRTVWKTVALLQTSNWQVSQGESDQLSLDLNRGRHSPHNLYRQAREHEGGSARPGSRQCLPTGRRNGSTDVETPLAIHIAACRSLGEGPFLWETRETPLSLNACGGGLLGESQWCDFFLFRNHAAGVGRIPIDSVAE